LIKRIVNLIKAKIRLDKKNGTGRIHWSSCIDNESIFDGYNYIGPRCVVASSRLGKFTYISSRSRINRVIIGAFCSIGQDCQIGGLSKHPINRISTHPAFYSVHNLCGKSFGDDKSFIDTNGVSIGNDVWIGARVMVLDGVRIGNGAVIAAGAVVVKDIPDYAVVGGVPAKLIKFRLSKNIVDDICADPWWSKSVEEISDLAKSNFFLKEY
jgi:chloramphenicol O-acetyltransferase type B